MTSLPAALPALLPAFLPAIIAALIGWRMYRRIRRLIGRQPVRTKRLVMTMVFFPILVVLLGLTGLRDPLLPMGLAAGVAIGVALAYVGLRTTVFEATPEGLFYTPNRTIGIALSLLFIARIAWRFGALYIASGGIDANAIQGFGRSPLTLLIFGVLAGYYTAYAAGVMHWSRQQPAMSPKPAT